MIQDACLSGRVTRRDGLRQQIFVLRVASLQIAINISGASPNFQSLPSLDTESAYKVPNKASYTTGGGKGQTPFMRASTSALH